MNGLIYHAFDTSNGKSYVGQTASTLEVRKKEHLGSKARLPFANALRKRSDSFEWSVLTSNITTQKDLDAAEIYWGLHFGCLLPEGYNLRLGSGHVIWSEEEKERNRRAQRIASSRPEVRERRSKAQRENKSKPEVREKISRTLRENPFVPSKDARQIMSDASRKNLPNKVRGKDGRWVKS